MPHVKDKHTQSQNPAFNTHPAGQTRPKSSPAYYTKDTAGQPPPGARKLFNSRLNAKVLPSAELSDFGHNGDGGLGGNFNEFYR